MLRPTHRKLIERARDTLDLSPTTFAADLRRWGEADAIEGLSMAGYERLMDYFTVCGFRDRRRPIVTLRTCRLVDDLPRQFGWTATAWDTVLHSFGIHDLRDSDGGRMLYLLVNLEKYGFSFERFNNARREISSAQLKLIQVARKQSCSADERYLPMLQILGGVNSAADLDRRGFDLCMAWLEREGFDRKHVTQAEPDFGARQGFASAAQLRLVRTLWGEWSGADDDAALNTWLERFHHVSTLRFLTAPAASKVITALKAMKRRECAGRERQPERLGADRA